MKTLILTVGLPQSGKSTWARESGYPIVERDAIRKTIAPVGFLGNPHRYYGEENRVTEIQQIMVESLFNAGCETVVVSDCHLKKKYRDTWKLWCAGKGIRVEYRFFLTPVDICIERAIKNFPNENKFPSIIMSMWQTHLSEKGFDGEFPFFIPRESDPINIDIGG